MNSLPSEIVHLLLKHCSLESCLALIDTNSHFRELSLTALIDKTQTRCPFVQPEDESWITCARVVASRSRRMSSFVVLSEETQDPLVYSLKIGMKTLNYVLKMDIAACEGLVDTNRHVVGGKDMKDICRRILDENTPTASVKLDMNHVSFPEEGVQNCIHHPHPDFAFFSVLQPKGWFLYCSVDSGTLPVFGPFVFSDPSSLRVFTYDGIVWVDIDGAVLPFVVSDTDVRFCRAKMIHGYPEQLGRGFVQGKGVLTRYLCNENGKRICDLKSGKNYFLLDEGFGY
ncbi:hypothetical protein CJU89_4865 [Yarrowia sp. B02]|nr:hypothetical protein CJU89_4865 [Yarrowia sp. B02]